MPHGIFKKSNSNRRIQESESYLSLLLHLMSRYSASFGDTSRLVCSQIIAELVLAWLLGTTQHRSEEAATNGR